MRALVADIGSLFSPTAVDSVGRLPPAPVAVTSIGRQPTPLQQALAPSASVSPAVITAAVAPRAVTTSTTAVKSSPTLAPRRGVSTSTTAVKSSAPLVYTDPCGPAPPGALDANGAPQFSKDPAVKVWAECRNRQRASAPRPLPPPAVPPPIVGSGPAAPPPQPAQDSYEYPWDAAAPGDPEYLRPASSSSSSGGGGGVRAASDLETTTQRETEAPSSSMVLVVGGVAAAGALALWLALR